MNLEQDVSYNDTLKKAWASDTKACLRAIAKMLPLKEVKIDWNPAGIAVSGDVTLMGMYDENNGVYVTASTPSYHGLMYRTIKHMTDYTGGSNQWIRNPHQLNLNEIAETIKRGTL